MAPPPDLVRIAGAGPAGLCAALLLARAGVGVQLREKRRDVGQRFREAVHGIENWSSPEPFVARLAAWGLDLGAALTPCHALWLCGERSVHLLQSPLPLFYLVRRGPGADALEGALLGLARAAGAEVRLGAVFAPGVAQIEATGPLRARRVCAEAGLHFRTRCPDLAAALVTREETPHGYAYLLIRDGLGSLCAVRFDGQPVTSAQLARCHAHLARHVRFDLQEPRRGAGFGSFDLFGALGGAGRWAIGEAAGLQDLLWGFGIRRALESAELATRCILTRADYPVLARRALGVPDRAALVNRCLWDRTAALGLPAYVRLLLRRGDLRAALLGATRERLLHRALYPLALRRLRRRYGHLAVRGAPDVDWRTP